MHSTHLPRYYSQKSELMNMIPKISCLGSAKLKFRKRCLFKTYIWGCIKRLCDYFPSHSHFYIREKLTDCILLKLM